MKKIIIFFVLILIISACKKKSAEMLEQERYSAEMLKKEIYLSFEKDSIESLEREKMKKLCKSLFLDRGEVYKKKLKMLYFEPAGPIKVGVKSQQRMDLGYEVHYVDDSDTVAVIVSVSSIRHWGSDTLCLYVKYRGVVVILPQ